MNRYISYFSVLALFIFMSGAVQAQKTLPQFSFTDLEGKLFTTQNLTKGIQTVAIFFDPYCDHCAQQAEWIAASADQFKNVNLVWVTTELQEPTAEFAQTHFAEIDLPNLHFLLDTEFMFDGYFGYSEAPSMYLYNVAGKRIKSLHEETPVATLLQYFSE